MFLQARRGAPARRRRLLRRGVPRARRALRGGPVAARRQPDRPRAGDAREADGGGQPHPRPPRARPPHRRPRPAPLEGARDAGRARPGHLRAHDLGPRPRVPHRRARRAASAWRSATSSTCCATPTAARSASSTCTSRTRRSSAGSRSRWRACRRSSALDDQRYILERLNAAEAFEKFLATKYVGQKRFGLEGAESAIPILDAILEAAADADLDGSVIGMPHRGRLNVLTNIVGKSYDQLFKEFEGQVDPDSMQGSGDVKYHLGQTRQVRRPLRQGHHRGAGRQPQPPRGRRPGRRRHGPRQAGRHQRSRGVLDPADPHARRRRLRRPGRGGRDAQHERHQGLPRRRHDPRGRQQPDRVHHHARVGAVGLLLHRRRQDHPGADHPRERRRPRGVRARRPARLRVPRSGSTRTS